MVLEVKANEVERNDETTTQRRGQRSSRKKGGVETERTLESRKGEVVVDG